MVYRTWTRLLFLGALLAVLATGVDSAYAQVDGAIGLGGQIGEPSGITLKVYHPEGLSYDFLAAFDLDNFFFLNVHGLYGQPLGDAEEVGVFYGPGGFVGIYDRGGPADELALGISGTVGLNYFIERFEIYAQITPRFQIVPATDGDIGGGLGVRYYF